MGTTQDGMMSLLGPGQLNDLLLGYYQDNGASSSNITDAEYEFLLSRGAPAENVQDMWDWYLRDLGYSGSLSDMILDFWSISREGLTLYTRPLVDDVGKSSRTVFKPQSGLFNGTADFVPLPELVTLIGDFTIPWQCDLDAAQDQAIMYGVSGTASYIRYDTVDWRVKLADIDYDFTTITNTAGECSLVRSGTTLTLTVGDQSEPLTCNTNPMHITIIGKHAAGYRTKGYLGSIKATDSIGLQFHHEHPTIIGTDAIWFDLSGNGLNATASVDDINAHHHVDDTLLFGSDHENQKGITVSDGASYYLNDDDTGLIPADVPIPALADGSGCAAYLVGGSVAPITYPGRAKYSIELVNNTCGLFDGTAGDYLEFSGLAGTESVVSSVGTATPTVSAGQIDCTAGTCSVIVLDNGWTIVLEEGEGTDCYAYNGITNIVGVVHASDINTLWSGEKDGENHNYLHGYELSGSVKVPANPNTGLSVLGQPLTVPPRHLTGQTWVNPECKELMDAELNMTGVERSFAYEGFVSDTTHITYANGAVHSLNGSSLVVDEVAGTWAAVTLSLVSGDITGSSNITVEFDRVVLGTGVSIRNPDNTGSLDLTTALSQTFTLDMNTTSVKFLLGEYSGLTIKSISVRELNSDHEQEVLFNESGTAKQLSLSDAGVELLGSELWDDSSASGTNWALSGADWTHTPGSTVSLVLAAVLTTTSTYTFSFIVSGMTAGSITPYAGATAGTAITANDTILEDIVCATSTSIAFTPTTDFDGVVTVMSIREVLTEEDNNFNNQILIGPKGEAVYEERQTDDIATKALKVIGVS